MINYDSILSAFDGKPTLLQWLKMVKKALDESVLKDVTITQNGEKVVFSFNFEDGTSISTPEVTLPKGDKGDKGDKGADIVRIETTGSAVVGVNTESTIRVELSDGSVKQFKTYAKNGSDGVNGTDGVSITGIDTVGNQVVGDETITTLRANYSDNTSDEFLVKAKNGKSEGSKIYLHNIALSNLDYTKYITLNVYSLKESLNFENALMYIPKGRVNSSYFTEQSIPVVFKTSKIIGALSAYRYENGVEKFINVYGVVFDTETNEAKPYNDDFRVYSVTDKLLGENL